MKIVSEVVVLLVSDLQGFSSNHSDTSFIGKVSCRGCLFLNLIDFFPESSVKKSTNPFRSTASSSNSGRT